MRAAILVFAIILVNFFDAHAQAEKKEDYLELTAGASFPMGHYRSADMYDSESGFAEVGEVFIFSFIHMVHKNIGLAAAVHGQRNPLNTKALETSFNQANFYNGVVPVSYVGQPAGNPPAERYYNWKFEKKSWWLGSILVGGYGQCVMSSAGKTVLTAKAMMGALYAAAPGLSGTSVSDTTRASITQSSGSAWGMGYTLAAGGKYKLAGKLFLRAEVEYLGSSELTFNDVKATFTSSRYRNNFPASFSQHTMTGVTKQKIASLNLNVGIGLLL